MLQQELNKIGMQEIKEGKKIEFNEENII